MDPFPQLSWALQMLPRVAFSASYARSRLPLLPLDASCMLLGSGLVRFGAEAGHEACAFGLPTIVDSVLKYVFVAKRCWSVALSLAGSDHSWQGTRFWSLACDWKLPGGMFVPTVRGVLLLSDPSSERCLLWSCC